MVRNQYNVRIHSILYILIVFPMNYQYQRLLNYDNSQADIPTGTPKMRDWNVTKRVHANWVAPWVITRHRDPK